MKISIVHPTRGRPDRVLETTQKWLDAASQHDDMDIDYRLGVETTEADLYASVLAQLQEKYHDKFRVRFIAGKRIDLKNLPKEEDVPQYLTATTKGNTLIRESQADWFVGIADDVHPCPDWNFKMYPYFKEHLGTNSVLSYQQEYQRKLVSHPIFTKEFFSYYGSVMYPGYIHTHGDVELWLLGRKEGWLSVLGPEITLVHHHPYFNDKIVWDELYSINNDKRIYEQGDEVLARRKKLLGF